MQNEQIREKERDGKTKGQRVWNKNKGNGKEQDNNKQRTVHHSIHVRQWNKGLGALTSPTAARTPTHFPCDQGFT